LQEYQYQGIFVEILYDIDELNRFLRNFRRYTNPYSEWKWVTGNRVARTPASDEVYCGQRRPNTKQPHPVYLAFQEIKIRNFVRLLHFLLQTVCGRTNTNTLVLLLIFACNGYVGPLLYSTEKEIFANHFYSQQLLGRAIAQAVSRRLHPIATITIACSQHTVMFLRILLLWYSICLNFTHALSNDFIWIQMQHRGQDATSFHYPCAVFSQKNHRENESVLTLVCGGTQNPTSL
jgi:hypothetical protein